MKKNKENQDRMQEEKAFSHSFHFYGKIILFTLSGAIMIGHGARMLYQGIFAPGSSYAPNTFDLFFDWLTLVILGCFILGFALSLYYHGMRKKASTRKQKISSDETVYSYPT